LFTKVVDTVVISWLGSSGCGSCCIDWNALNGITAFSFNVFGCFFITAFLNGWAVSSVNTLARSSFTALVAFGISHTSKISLDNFVFMSACFWSRLNSIAKTLIAFLLALISALWFADWLVATAFELSAVFVVAFWAFIWHTANWSHFTVGVSLTFFIKIASTSFAVGGKRSYSNVP
jgi:hypothetical protein